MAYVFDVERLLQQAIKFAGDNYDVLQQSVLVNIRRKKTAAMIAPLREMIANGYNVGLNALLLGRIYIDTGNQTGYDTLKLVAGAERIGDWNKNMGVDASTVEERFLETRVTQLIGEFDAMLDGLLKLLTLNKFNKDMFRSFEAVATEMKKHCNQNKVFVRLIEKLLDEFKEVVGGADKIQITGLKSLSTKVIDALKQTQFSLAFVDAIVDLSDKMNNIIRN